MKPNIKFTSLLDPIKDIHKRNKVFKSLSAEGQRLEVAWDALKLLSNDVIKTSNGHYWNYRLRKVFDDSFDSQDAFVNLNDNNKVNNCKVCARGGIILSQIRLGNSINPLKYGAIEIHTGFNTFTGKSLTRFSKSSLSTMESEYECSFFRHPYRYHTKDKLMNILCNVLVNGDFNAEDKTNYLV